MSEKTPTNLRYLRKQSLEHERKIHENYFHDLIYNYGVDTYYFRHDTKFPDQIDLTPNLSGAENLIYGENPHMAYYLSGDMIVYIEVENDIFELNKFGLVPNENITIYFTVEDFNHKFASQLGKKSSFYDTISFSGLVPTGVSSIEVTAPFVGNDVLSGSISTTVLTAVSSYPISSFNVNFETSAGYQVPINPYIHKSDVYQVSGGDYLAASQGSITVSTSSYTGSASVGVLYYEPESTSKYHTNIMPQVGDIFRMSFFDENHEEFELTQIADKTLTPDGINPLLGKYIWKCAAVRRIPSHEDVIGDQNTEERLNDEIHDVESWAIENITNTITDYTSGDDDVYGGYENDDSPIIDDSEGGVAVFNITEWNAPSG